MIITRIQGGLGNQMFQYAIGRVLANINKTNLFLDTQGIYLPVNMGHLKRDYMLDAFPIEAEIASENFLNNIRHGRLLYKFKIKKISHYKQLVFDEIPPTKSHYKYAELFLTPKFTYFYPELMSKSSCDIYLDGYWQSFKYFEQYEDIIKKHFTFKREILNYREDTLAQINNSESVSLHFRLTDRVSTEADLKNFRFLDFDYYIDSIKYIQNKIEKPHFFIFSDNIEWCKENVKINYPITFIEGYNEFTDMHLMSQCKHNIIAHSTFSWWASWLNCNNNKIVICPEKWFSNQTPSDLIDLIPESWIRI